MKHINQILLVFALLSTTSHGTEIDWDMRCCFTAEQIQQAAVVITLKGSSSPVAHISLTAPGDVQIGLDSSSKSFFLPNSEGIYAYGPVDDIPVDHPEWGTRIKRIIALNRAAQGDYTIKVIGQYQGAYTLSIRVNNGPSSVADKSIKDAPITPKEIHAYLFRLSRGTDNQRREILLKRIGD